MEHSKPTLLWGIDKETGGISALPASPLLLPAIIGLGALKVASWLYKPKPKKQPLPANFNWEEYSKNKKEYDYLLAKIQSGKPLTPMEETRWLTELPYPSWSKGERWQY